MVGHDRLRPEGTLHLEKHIIISFLLLQLCRRIPYEIIWPPYNGQRYIIDRKILIIEIIKRKERDWFGYPNRLTQ